MSASMSACLIVTFVASVGGAAEPAGLAKVVKGADKAVIDAVVAADGSCAGAALTAADMRGTRCRVLAAQAVAQKLPLANDADVDARVAIVDDVLATAEYVAAYRPSAPEPGLGKVRFDAHRFACSTAFSAIADLEAMPIEFPGHRRAADQLAGTPAPAPSSTSKKPANASSKKPSGPAGPAVLPEYLPAPPPTLQMRACACAQRTLDLSVGADVTPQESSEVQGVLTRQRCLLGGSGLTIGERKSPQAALSGADAAIRSAADDASPEGRLVALAKGRVIEMSRCTSKHVQGDKVTDPGKLTACACGVAKHWKLPFQKDDPSLQARLPISEDGQLFLPVVVEGGAVARCSDVEGALLGR